MARILATKESYFAAALELLAADGHGALRIGALCRRVGVTTGSFYHYFGSFDGFVDELLTSWEQEKTQRIFADALRVEDVAGRVRTIKDRALTLPHEAESAIRSWSHVNGAVARVQQRVDDERVEAVRLILSPVVGDGAPLLASMAVSILVGYQQRRAPVDLDELRGALDLFETVVLHHAVTT